MTALEVFCQRTLRLLPFALGAAAIHAGCTSSSDEQDARYFRGRAGQGGDADRIRGAGGAEAGEPGSRADGGAGSAPESDGGVAGAAGSDMSGAGSAGKLDAGGGGDAYPGGEGGGGSRSDGCPEIGTLGPSDLDHDGDGFHDVCDEDDDDDGVADSGDSHPLDPKLPGNVFSPAPGFVLNHPCMVKALAEVEARGFVIPTERVRGALVPPIGYFLRPERSGVVLAATDGATLGVTLTGMEHRRRHVGDDVYDAAFVDFFDTNRTAGTSRDVLRGRARQHTAYGFIPGTLIVAAASDGGPGANPYAITLVVAIRQEMTRPTSCPAPLGRWRLSSAPIWKEIEPSELRAMCVDEDAGYIPNETWTRAGGSVCRCTLDFEVSCDP